ncbi:MAG: flippase [Patescibacteria group bacterium]|jgi:O-antigen/teichoic acid export membrane protein
MRLSTRVAYNTIIQTASKVIATVLGLFSIALMTRYLGASGFGQYTTIITFLSFFAIIADFGLTLVTVQLTSHKGADEKKILNNLLSFRLLSALIFIGIGPLAVFFFPYQSAVKIGVLISSLSFFFIALNQIFVGLFQRHLRMDKVSIAEVAGRIALLLGIYFASSRNYGLYGILAATVISSAISFFLHFMFSRRLVRIKLEFDWGLWKEIIIKSWPLALTITFNLLYLKTDTLILSLIKSQAEVGIYGAAYKVIDVLITLPFLFSGIILPILTLAWSEGNKENFKKVLQKSFDIMAILAFPLVAGAWMISSETMELVAGRDFLAAGPALNILMMAAGAIFLGNIFAHAIIAIDKQKSILPAYIFTALSSVAGYLLFIPRYSYFGAAWVTVYSEVLIAFSSFYIVWRFTGFRMNWKVLAKSFFAAALMYAFLAWLGEINLFLKMFAGVLSYFTILYLLKGITKDDLLILKNRELPAPVAGDINKIP